MSKMNLTEATMLALQGKLEEKKTAVRKTAVRKTVEHKNNRRLKKENIDVNVGETNVSVMDNETIVDTPNATVIVDKKDAVTSTELPVDNVEIPVEGDETVIPEEVADVDAEEIDVPVESEEEIPFMEESKKVENVNIEVSDDGKEVEVTTDNGEEVEVKDETTDEEEKEDVEDATEIPMEENKKITEETEDTTRLGGFLCDDVEKLKKAVEELNEYIATYTTDDSIKKPIEQIEDFVSYWSIHANTLAGKPLKFESADKDNKKVEAKKLDMSNWSSNEIIDYIIDNFTKITGRKIDSIYSKDGSEEEPFNQKVIDATADKIANFVTKHGVEEKQFWDNIVYDLDNKLLSRKTEGRDLKAKCIENSKRVYLERKNGVKTTGIKTESKKVAKRRGIKVESKRAVKENKVKAKKEEARAKMIKERVERIMSKRQESKKTFKYSLKSFNESLTNFYTKNTRTIKKAEVSKLNVVGKNIVVEAKLYNKEDAVKSVKLEMKPITTVNSFTRYNVTELSNIKTENKGNRFNATMLTLKNKYGVTECKYINKK